MGTILVYIIKSGICLSVFYLFYKILLSNETFHRFNRAALLGILFLSVVLPFIEISSHQPLSEIPDNLMLLLQSEIMSSNTSSIALIEQPETPAVTLTWLHALLLIYIAGIIFLAIRNIYSIIKLYILIKNGKRQVLENNITLIVHNSHTAPFSWFGYIVISEKDFDENGNEIISHEKAHIKKRHSIDLLICHIYDTLQWINPVAWLFKRELQNIHEYEADEAVLKKGINTKQYQLLLIQKAVGAKLFALANNFNKNKLQKRIAMMSKNKSNPLSKLKYLYVLPMLAIVITTFANPQVKNEMEKISSVSISDFISQNGNSTHETDAEQMPLMVNLTVNTQDSIAEQKPEKSNSNVVIIVDGKAVNTIDDIDRNDIKSISVIKNKTEAEKDGDEKKHFIIITTSKDSGTLTAYVSDSINDKMFIDIKTLNIDSLYKPHFYFSNERNDSLLKAHNFNIKSWNDSLAKAHNFDIKSWNDSLAKAHNFDIKSWNDSLAKA
ncbi:MAG: M56 family metallopeptidase, partial [Prevotellaceae bacterium]|nr:M56 family metallopeptidase [Prevotellaceae bacterium]